MKKLTLILLSCLLLSLFVPCSYAADAPDEAIAFAENYLRRCARNKFLFEDNDILQDTIATLTEEAKEALIQTVKENETEFREKHSRRIIPEALQGEFSSDTVYDNQPIEEIINTFPNFISNKISYFRNDNQKGYETGVASYGDVKIGYFLESSYSSGNNLVYLQFKEMVTYTYDSQFQETGQGADYKICLYQMNDRWIICNIVSLNDYFDEQYRFGDFNLEEKMQETDEFWAQLKSEQNTEGTAGAPDEAADAPDEAIAFAENYLCRCTRNIYFFEDNDILQDTAATLTDEEKDALIQTVKENESEFREKHIQKFIPEPLQGKIPSDTVYDNQSIEEIINTFPDYISKKNSYFNHFYQIRNNRHDMNIHYILESSYASGNNLAYIYLREIVSFTYDDQFEETATVTDYKVCLYQMNDRWIICNIVSLNDDFDEQYRFSDFNLEEKMKKADEYWAQIKAKNEAGQNNEDSTGTKDGKETGQAKTYPLLWIIPTGCVVLAAIAVVYFLVMKKRKKIS